MINLKEIISNKVPTKYLINGRLVPCSWFQFTIEFHSKTGGEHKNIALRHLTLQEGVTMHVNESIIIPAV